MPRVHNKRTRTLDDFSVLGSTSLTADYFLSPHLGVSNTIEQYHTKLCILKHDITKHLLNMLMAMI